MKEEFMKVWDIIEEFYGAFGFSLRARLSLHDPEHPEKYLGDQERWKTAESNDPRDDAERKADAFDGIGEAAFYGPKIDFMAKDAIGRLHQMATIQLDMNHAGTIRPGLRERKRRARTHRHDPCRHYGLHRTLFGGHH